MAYQNGKLTYGRAKGSQKVKGSGRKKGSTNKADADARKAIAHFIDCNIDRLNSFVDRIAEDDPEAAFKCIMSVVEYHIPKLARVDGHEGDTNITYIVNTGINAPPNSGQLMYHAQDVIDEDGEVIDRNYTRAN